MWHLLTVNCSVQYLGCMSTSHGNRMNGRSQQQLSAWYVHMFCRCGCCCCTWNIYQLQTKGQIGCSELIIMITEQDRIEDHFHAQKSYSCIDSLQGWFTK